MRGESTLRPVRSDLHKRAEALRRVLGATVIEHDVEQHGLAWWYPQVKAWPAVRSVGGAGGGGRAALPLNAEALDFLGGRYWVGEKSQDRCSHGELMDEENYRLGFEPTLLELDRSVCRALGLLPPPLQPRATDPMSPTPAVLAALDHLLELVDAIAAHEFLSDLVYSEATRLIVRARAMMHGSRFTAARSQCMHCHEVDSVISDEDRAVCINPWCRTPDGNRHCWRVASFDAAGRLLPAGQEHKATRRDWVEVTEPDIRGRGQLSDEQLSRWADVS